MLYPLLLQGVTPTVGVAVRDYSHFERRPWGQLLATVDFACVHATLLEVYVAPAPRSSGRG